MKVGELWYQAAVWAALGLRGIVQTWDHSLTDDFLDYLFNNEEEHSDTSSPWCSYISDGTAAHQLVDNEISNVISSFFQDQDDLESEAETVTAKALCF